MHYRISRLTLLAGCLALATVPSNAATLAEIYELALKNDPQLKIAEATYKADRETRRIARSALLPQIVGTAKFTESDQDINDQRLQAAGEQLLAFETNVEREADGRTYAISLQQAIFDASAWFSFRSGSAVDQQALAKFSYEQQNLIVRVVESYLNVLRARDNLEASQAEERAAKRALEQAKQRFDVGLIAVTDVNESRAVYDLTFARRLTDEGQLEIAKENLYALTNQRHGDLWSLSKKFKVEKPEPADPKSWEQNALAGNFQLQAAMAGAKAAKMTARSKASDHLPTISANVTWSDFESDGEDFDATANAGTMSQIPGMSTPDQRTRPFSQEVEGYEVNVNLDIPIFSGGRVSATRRQAWQQYQISEQNRVLLQRQIANQTRAQYIAVRTDAQRVKAQNQSIVSSESALRATKAGYDVGTRNIVDVLNAQRTLYASVRDYANARYDYILSLLRLKLQAGTLSPADVYSLNESLVAPGPSRASRR